MSLFSFVSCTLDSPDFSSVSSDAVWIQHFSIVVTPNQLWCSTLGYETTDETRLRKIASNPFASASLAEAVPVILKMHPPKFEKKLGRGLFKFARPGAMTS